MNKKNVMVMSHPETKKVLTVSKKNPEYGSIRLESVQQTFQGGFLRTEKRVTFLNGLVKDLEAWISSENIKEGTMLGGKIVKLQSYEPFFEGQTPRINPTTGELALCKETGREVYLEFRYSPNMSEEDRWVFQEDEDAGRG